MLTIETITEYSKFESIKETWNELLKKSITHVPYLTHEWFKIALEYLDNVKELHIILVKDDEEIIAIAPFLVSRIRLLGFSITKLGFIKNSYTPFQDFILTVKKEESIAVILKYLKSKSRQWNLVELEEMRADSITTKLLKKACSSNGLFFHEEFKSNSFYLPVDQTWEQALKQLKPKIRREFKRKHKRLAGLGDLKLEIFTDIEQINKHLGILFDLYAKSWKGREKKTEFYYKLAEVFSKGDNLFLFTLFLNNKPIGYLYTIKIDNTLYCIKTTYDSSYAAFAPGVVLTYKSIEHMHNHDDVREFDIGRGEERYKKDWSTSRYIQVTSYLGNQRLMNFIYFAIRFRFLPFCRLNPILKYLIPIVKKPVYFLIGLNNRMKNKELFKYFKNLIVNTKSIIYDKTVTDLFKFTISNDEGNQNNSKNLTYKFAQSDDRFQLAIAMQAPNLKQLSQRFDRKDKCLMVLKNNKILYYFWFAYDEILLNEIDESMRLKNDQVFLYEHSAITNTKLKNIFSNICEKLTEDDAREILTIISLTDQENGNSFSKLGFKKHKRIIKIGKVNKNINYIS